MILIVFLRNKLQKTYNQNSLNFILIIFEQFYQSNITTTWRQIEKKKNRQPYTYCIYTICTHVCVYVRIRYGRGH